jgi:hypothetical protein
VLKGVTVRRGKRCLPRERGTPAAAGDQTAAAEYAQVARILEEALMTGHRAMLLAGIIGLVNSFRMMRLPDPTPRFTSHICMTHRVPQQERIRLHHVSDSYAAPRGEPHLESGEAGLGFPGRTRELGQL